MLMICKKKNNINTFTRRMQKANTNTHWQKWCINTKCTESHATHWNRLTEFLVCKMAQMICAMLLLDWWILFFPVFSVVLLCPKLSHLLKTFCDCFIESCLPFSLTECVHRRFYTSKKAPINCVFGPTIKCLLHLQAIKWLATNNKKRIYQNPVQKL